MAVEETQHESKTDLSVIAEEKQQEPNVKAAKETESKKDLRFWLILLGLVLAGFVTATDSTIIFVILPTISRDLAAGQSEYVWLGNAYLIAQTAIQPLYGQLSNIFGRRYPMIFALGLFGLGSGIAAGSNSSAMFIAGRLVQGLGAGGVIMLMELIVCDILPLRERSKYLGMVLTSCAIGSIAGPVIGGAITTRTTWRWAFWINLPVIGLTLLIVVPFLRVSWKRSTHWSHALARIDYLGNSIFIASVTAILIGLIRGGVLVPWSSYQTIVPLVLGFVGLAVFLYQQTFCKEPTMPLRLFTHRTAAVTFVLDFLIGVLLNWAIYVLPLYFQSLKGDTPLSAGIDILPLNAFMIPSASVAGALLTKTGKFKPFHWIGFGMLAIGSGLFSLLNADSSTAAWVCFQIIMAIGIGFPLTTQLPAIQACLAEEDTATSTSTYAFLRSFGFMWGSTIPSIIFNAAINAAADQIQDPAVQGELENGGAYSFANSVYTLSGQTVQQTQSVYAQALRVVWLGAVAFSLLGFLLVFIEKHVDLRTVLNTEFGIDRKKETEKVIEEGVIGVS